MAIYKFKCPEHEYFKQRIKMSEFEKLKENNFQGVCPKCDCEVKNIIGAPRVEFVGPGFYYTDSQTKQTKEEKVTVYNEKYTSDDE